MSNFGSGFGTRQIKAATLEEFAEKSNEYMYEGYRDAMEGQPYNKHYDGWGKLEQCQYEYGRHTAAIGKCHGEAFLWETIKAVNAECAFIVGRAKPEPIDRSSFRQRIIGPPPAIDPRSLYRNGPINKEPNPFWYDEADYRADQTAMTRHTAANPPVFEMEVDYVKENGQVTMKVKGRNRG